MQMPFTRHVHQPLTPWHLNLANLEGQTRTGREMSRVSHSTAGGGSKKSSNFTSPVKQDRFFSRFPNACPLHNWNPSSQIDSQHCIDKSEALKPPQGQVRWFNYSRTRKCWITDKQIQQTYEQWYCIQKIPNAFEETSQTRRIHTCTG